MENILSRRSIRKYTSEPVGEEIIQEILKGGMSAPSAKNQQPWQFVIINEKKLLHSIAGNNRYCRMLKEAPVAILICGDMRNLEYEIYWEQDCSAATQNILLAIQAKGLGGVWIGLHPNEERIENIRKYIDLPEYIIPFSLISLGYPAEEKPPSDRYEKARVHYNKWQEA